MREIFLLIVYFYSLPAASRFDNSCFKCKSCYPGFFVVVKQQRGREGSKLIKVKKRFFATNNYNNVFSLIMLIITIPRPTILNNLFEKKNVIPPRFSDEFYCLFCILRCFKYDKYFIFPENLNIHLSRSLDCNESLFNLYHTSLLKWGSFSLDLFAKKSTKIWNTPFYCSSKSRFWCIKPFLNALLENTL
ncbi:hypothetical protein T01_7048 [Trichinella spiralis]|uniref:Uncharacterized protein n=1 Tax=Trichinella spiralis TaxID=6334 RepID=A0A0V1BH71_TRISP|nr:hypothetical protein T01_7048 [Trichinella spiralis]